MEGREYSLVPQWLKSSASVSRVDNMKNQLTSSPCTDHINYSGCQRSSSSRGSGFSRSSTSSGRSRHDRKWEKDIDNFFDKDKPFHAEHNHDHSDYVDRILSNRFENELLRGSRSMNSGRWRENRFPRPSGDVSNPQRNHGKSDGMVAVFEEEFPLLGLGAEDKHGSSDLGRALSSSSSTYSVLTDTSSVIVSNGLSTVGPSMAETLAQGPSRSHTPPRLSIDTQKFEELALKQSRLLIPMTPSTPRSLVASPSEKLKVKTGRQQQQYPFSYSRSTRNLDMQKIGSGNSRNVSASRELNGVCLTAKENSNNNSTPSARVMTLEKRLTYQTQSRSDFFKNLSRKSSLKDPCSGNPLTDENSCVITENGGAGHKYLKFSSNGEQRHRAKPVLYLDEEIAFLRSLGWEESAGEDESLTEEEIRDFYEKYLKLQSSSKHIAA